MILNKIKMSSYLKGKETLYLNYYLAMFNF